MVYVVYGDWVYDGCYLWVLYVVDLGIGDISFACLFLIARGLVLSAAEHCGWSLGWLAMVCDVALWGGYDGCSVMNLSGPWCVPFALEDGYDWGGCV